MRRLILIAVLACGGSRARPPAQPPADPPAPAPKTTTCDQDPNITEHAQPAVECARQAFARGEYDTADALAERVMERFPYSKLALEAEELRADVLFARGDFEAAMESYDVFVRLHPTNERVEDIKKKRDDAKARLRK